MGHISVVVPCLWAFMCLSIWHALTVTYNKKAKNKRPVFYTKYMKDGRLQHDACWKRDMLWIKKQLMGTPKVFVSEIRDIVLVLYTDACTSVGYGGVASQSSHETNQLVGAFSPTKIVAGRISKDDGPPRWYTEISICSSSWSRSSLFSMHVETRWENVGSVYFLITHVPLRVGIDSGSSIYLAKRC